MFKWLQIGDWTIEIDQVATQRIYATLPLLTSSCDCLFCRNYAEACKSLSPTVLEFFDNLGIDPTKATEVYELSKLDNGLHSYGGIYHLVGRMVDTLESVENFEVDKTFEVSFTTKLELTPEEFTDPVVQMNFLTDIVWVASI